LIAAFNDDRNRLSYYHPRLKVRTPVTKFIPVDGDNQTYLSCDYREATKFMQKISARKAFIRGDFSSAKYDKDGRIVESQDPYTIEKTVVELFKQLSLAKRNLGGRIAIREYVPHDAEVRYFIRDGDVLYRDSLDKPSNFPDKMASEVAKSFDKFAWSVDFIQHESTGKWYCIDMGLDGVYHDGSEWIAISEHLDKSYSPERHTDELLAPERYQF